MNNQLIIIQRTITLYEYILRLTNKRTLPAKYNQLHDKET